ncbi:MAG: Ig-like domain-containing protein [Nitrospirota bacterium]
MKHIFSLVLALVIVLLVVNVVSEGVMPDGVAVATQLQGTVNIFTSESPEGRLIRNNDSIAKNDRVEVQGNSMLELRLPDGGYLRLSENASLTMRMLRFEKRTGTLYLQAFLENGRLWAKINKRAVPESWVEVITNTALVASKDSVCGVDAVEDASTSVSVYEGVVPAVSAAREAARTVGRTSAPAQVQPVSVQTFQQVSVPAQAGALQPRDFDPKAVINDWIRWNLQRDAREGLVSITVAPASSTITRGASLQFAAVAHYPENTEKDITWFATWSSSAVNVAKIDPFGTAAGSEIGAANISAAIEDMHGSTVLNVSRDIVSIKVTPASRSIMNGAVQQFTAMGTFSDKTVKDITSSAVWRSSNTNIAFVDATGRTVAGNVAGTAVISASLGTKSGRATLKVRRELISITVMPESAMIIPGDKQEFGAVGSYSDKTTQNLTEIVQWETSDIRIAVMDQVQAGRVLGQKAGSATITATFKKISGSGTITVEMIPPP